VDKAGKIAWSKVYGIPEQPDNEELMRAIQQLE
jgi:hypothetical protein